MKASKYNFVTTFSATQEKLLFNTLTTAFAALSPDAYRQVNAVLTDPTGEHDPSLVNYLHKNGFLVIHITLNCEKPEETKESSDTFCSNEPFAKLIKA